MRKINPRGGVPEVLTLVNGKGKTAAEKQFVADQCKTTVGHLKQIGYGRRGCDIVIAEAIDKFTKGAIPVTTLRSDLDWDYLVRSVKRSKAEAKKVA